MKRIVFCNAPRWFSSIWNVIARVLPETVLKKVDILYDMKGLDKYIHPSQRPVYYGGTDVELGCAIGHKEFLALELIWKQKQSKQLQALELANSNKVDFSSSSSSVGVDKSSSSSNNNDNNNSINSRTTTTSNMNSSSRSSSSMLTWFRSQFNKVPVAYLGEKNSYRFNHSTKTWEMEINENQYDDDGGGGDVFSTTISGINRIHGRLDTTTGNVNADDDDDTSTSTSSNSDDGSPLHLDRDVEYEFEDMESALSHVTVYSDQVKYKDYDSTKSRSRHHHHNQSHSTSAMISSLSSNHRRNVKRDKMMSQEELDEHGLVLAIQAAHLAASFSKRNSSSINNNNNNNNNNNSRSIHTIPSNTTQPVTMSSSSSTHLLNNNNNDNIMNNNDNITAKSHHHLTASVSSSLPSSNISSKNIIHSPTSSSSSSSKYNRYTTNKDRPLASSDNDPSVIISTKISAVLFLLVISLYIFSQSVYISLFTLLPVWFVIPISAGGLEYNVRDMALLLSCTSIIILIVHSMMHHRFEHILKASPVRALRMGCGLLIIILFFMPWYLCKHYHYHSSSNNSLVVMNTNIPTTGVDGYVEQQGSSSNNILTRTNLIMNVLSSVDVFHQIKYIKIFDKVLSTQGPSLKEIDGLDHHNSVTMQYDYIRRMENKTSHVPSQSFISLLIPSILLATLVISVQICRRASSVLLYLTLASTFTAPKAIRNAINFFIEVIGPTLSSFLFTLGYSQQLKYPLDGSCFFAGTGCIILLVYIESIFLTVQFRGDYGVMTDYQELITCSYHPENSKYYDNGSSDGLPPYGTVSSNYGYPLSSTSSSSSSYNYIRQRQFSQSKIFGYNLQQQQQQHQQQQYIPLFTENLLCIPLGNYLFIIFAITAIIVIIIIVIVMILITIIMIIVFMIIFIIFTIFIAISVIIIVIIIIIIICR